MGNRYAEVMQLTREWITSHMQRPPSCRRNMITRWHELGKDKGTTVPVPKYYATTDYEAEEVKLHAFLIFTPSL